MYWIPVFLRPLLFFDRLITAFGHTASASRRNPRKGALSEGTSNPAAVSSSESCSATEAAYLAGALLRQACGKSVTLGIRRRPVSVGNPVGLTFATADSYVSWPHT